MTPTGLAASRTVYDTDNGDTIDRVKKTTEGTDFYTAEMFYEGPVERLSEIRWGGGMDVSYKVESSDFGLSGPDYRLPIRTSFKNAADGEFRIETDLTRSYGADGSAASGGFTRKRLLLASTSGGTEDSPYDVLSATGTADTVTRSWLLADVYSGSTGYLYGRGRSQTPAWFDDAAGRSGNVGWSVGLDKRTPQFRFTGTDYVRTESLTVDADASGVIDNGELDLGLTSAEHTWTGRGVYGTGTELFHPGRGGLQSYQAPSGLCVNLTHEQPWGRIVSMTVREPNGSACDGSGTVLFDQSIDYGDPCVEYADCGGVPGESVAAESLSYEGTLVQDWTYTYDSTGRLKSAALDGGGVEYTYRPDGALTGVSTSGTFPEAEDGFTERSDSPYLFESNEYNVEYDDHGGLSTGRVTGFEALTFTYDTRGRLLSATDGNITARYDYDLNGWRVLKRVKDEAAGTAELTRFVYNGTNLVAERIERASCTGGTCVPIEREERRYVWLGMRPVAMVRRVCNAGTGLDWATCSADYEYFDIVTERRGAPVMVVDATRNVIWSGKYSPYGLLYDEQGSLEFNLRLPGQYQDRETGWQYNGLRYYIPQMMRYNRPEPIGQAGSLDLFMYAGGDPVNRIDPTGLDDVTFHEGDDVEWTFDDDTNILTKNGELVAIKKYDEWHEPALVDCDLGVCEPVAGDKIEDSYGRNATDIIYDIKQSEHDEEMKQELIDASLTIAAVTASGVAAVGTGGVSAGAQAIGYGIGAASIGRAATTEEKIGKGADVLVPIVAEKVAKSKLGEPIGKGVGWLTSVILSVTDLFDSNETDQKERGDN